MAWQTQASCTGIDTEMFFTADDQSHQGVEFLALARTCYDCRVRLECRLSGIAEGYGVWGNSSPRERMAMRVRMVPRGSVMAADLDRVRTWISGLLGQVNAGHELMDVLVDAGISGDGIKALLSETMGDRRARRSISEQRNVKARSVA